MKKYIIVIAVVAAIGLAILVSIRNSKQVELTNKPTRVQKIENSLSISMEEFQTGQKTGNELVGHIGGQIFYVHRSLVNDAKELFLEVQEDNRNAFRIVINDPEINRKYTVKHINIVIDGIEIPGYGSIKNQFYAGNVDKTRTLRIGDYYVAKVSKTFSKPVFSFSDKLPQYYPANPKDIEKIADKIIYNQFQGIHFFVD